MDVVVGIVWWIILNNPIDVREVEASLRNICTKQCASFRLAKLKIRRRSLLLLLLSMDVLDRYVHVVEQIAIELDSVTARHEDHDLLFSVPSKESEEQLKLDCRILDYDVALFEVIYSFS